MGKRACPVYLAVDACILQFGIIIHHLFFQCSHVQESMVHVQWPLVFHYTASGVLPGEYGVSLRGHARTKHNQIPIALGHGRAVFQGQRSPQ